MANILLIENEESLRYLIKTHLKDSDYKFWEARNDTEGLKILSEQRPDLVLLDIKMPRGYNWHVLEEIKKRPETQDIPTIVIIVPDEKFKAIAMGANSYIQKPFPGEILHREVDRFLNGPVSDILADVNSKGVQIF